ncbi:MAG TPA: F0F1 ATP synthase subunit alpha, partial [Acidimicrobiales bacterium]|nr:F0F1 ATP synthase subunit alpha [Acidimicrobiales bacterium]
DRGYRLTELLKQGLNEPMPVEEQVMVIYAGSNGYVDDVPVSEVRRFESEMLQFLRVNAPQILEQIRTAGTLPEEAELRKVLESFKSGFDTGQD